VRGTGTGQALIWALGGLRVARGHRYLNGVQGWLVAKDHEEFDSAGKKQKQKEQNSSRKSGSETKPKFSVLNIGQISSKPGKVSVNSKLDFQEFGVTDEGKEI